MDTFSIVFLCTGNRFRSPLAAAFLHRLTLGLPVTVTSRGILELRSTPALREALELAPWYGIDLSAHRSEQIDASAVTDADLILGFEQAHARHAVVEADAPRERTFTLPEFVHLLQTLTAPPTNDVVERARALVEQAASRRRADPANARVPDVPDPFGRSRKLQSRIAGDIRDLVIDLAASLFEIRATEGLPAMPAAVPQRRRPFWRRSATRR